MKKIIIAILFICTLLLSFFSCTHKDGIIPASTTPSPTVTPSVTPVTIDSAILSDTTVCFQRDVLPIFLNSCAVSNCHDAKSASHGYNLSNYKSIVSYGITAYYPYSSNIFTSCSYGSMPRFPFPRFDSTQLKILWIWIAKGAPNNSACSASCDTTHFAYSNGVAPILAQNCYSCHATTSAIYVGGAVVLDVYDSVKVQALNGKLLGDIRHSTGFNAMPTSGLQIQECQITQINRWVQAGAPNN